MRSFLLLLGVLACVALVYAVGVHNGFVWLDHFEIVEGALLVRTPGEALALLCGDHNFPGYHRPVYNLLHSLDHALFGLEPLGYQLTARLWHLANVALVFALARRLGWSASRGALLALLFGLHPLNTSVAGLIHAKADSFVLACLAASLLCFLGPEPAEHAARHGATGRARLVLSLFAFLVALHTKESAFLFPLGALAWWLARERGRASNLPWRAWLSGLGALTLVALAERLGATSLRYESPLGLGERLATFALVWVDDVRRLCLPFDLAVADTVTRFGALSPQARFQGLGALVFLLAGQAWLWRRHPFARKWIALFHLALLPVAQLVPILHFRADRFLYVPSLAFAGLLVEAGARLVRRAPRPRAARLGAGAAAGLLALAWAARDVTRLPELASDERLFSAELRRRPDYLEGLTHLARALDRRGRHEEAGPLYAAAFAPRPAIVSYFDGERTLLAWTANLLARGRSEEALAVLDRYGGAVASPPVRSELAYNRGVALANLGRDAEALPLFAGYLAEHPGDARCAWLVGRLAFALGRTAQARAAWERYLSLAPDAPERSVIEEALGSLPD